MSDFPEAWWSEWSEAIKTKYSLNQTTKGEWHGPCPCCAGTDRFWIRNHNGIVKAFCRQGCEFKDMVAEMRHDGVWPDKQADNVITLREASVSLDDFGDTTQLYHERKGVELFGSKLSGDNVVVQLFNTDKQRVGTQTISPDGKKKFNAGLDKSGGCFGVVGKLTGVGLAYVAEGWATSASVYAATGTTCIFALDSGHMPVAVEAIGEAWPELELVIAADNDEAGIRAAKATGKRWAVPQGQGQDWNDVHVALGVVAVMEGLQRAKISDGLFTLMSDIEIRSPEWLIGNDDTGILEADTLGIIFGASGAGKTFVSLGMAMCIASGKSYHGYDVSQGPVAYVAGEGNHGFARRVAAWCSANDVKLGDVPFYKSNGSITLSNETLPDILESLHQIEADKGKLKLIVLDTLDRTIEGVEDKNEDTKKYLDLCDIIRTEFSATILIIAHVGHSATERAKGSTKLKDRMDASYLVAEWGPHKVMLTPKKMKDADEPEALAFLKVPVTLEAVGGKETSSLVLELTHDKPMDKKDPDHIREVILEQIKTIDAFGEAPRSDLKEAVGLELECSQRTANRYIKRLIDDGVLALRGNVVVAA